MKGHVDRWCKENCDARNIQELREVGIILLPKHIDFKNAHNDKIKGTIWLKYNASYSNSFLQFDLLFGTLWVSFDDMVILYISGYIYPGLDPAISLS